MLSLLTISLHYNNYVAHLWHIAINDDFKVSIALFILVLLILLICTTCATSLTKRLRKSLNVIGIIIAVSFCISFAWNIINMNTFNPTIATIYDMNNSVPSNHYSHHSLIKTNYIIGNNHQQLQTEKLALNHIKNYHHQHNILLHRIYNQEHFDSMNSKFMNRHYIYKPAWYNYL